MLELFPQIKTMGEFANDFDENIFNDVTNIQWRLEESKSDSILFYKLNENQEDILWEKLTNLSNSNRPKIVILNRKPKFEMSLLVNHYFILNNVNDWSELQKIFCDYYLPTPSGIKFIGITGTNGKTSTVSFINQLLSFQGEDVLSIGTLGVFKNQIKLIDFSLTSPSYIDFRKTVFKHALQNSYVVFEMSSHALDQDRFYKIELSAAGWTSFSQDHLDYHKTMDSYFQAKKKIIKSLLPGAHLYLPKKKQELFDKIQSEKVKFANFIDVNSWSTCHFLTIDFMKENLELAYAISNDVCPQELQKYNKCDLKNVPGRVLVKTKKGKTVVIDYAHTPDALKNICQHLSQTATAKNGLKVLFGCGGDRDKTKRPIMGQVVSEFASFIYVTSDNPRTEDPEKIIDEIMPGILKPYYRNADRKMAIKKAMDELEIDQTLLIAGKGHEDYMIFGKEKTPYSDEDEVEKYFKDTKSI